MPIFGLSALERLDNRKWCDAHNVVNTVVDVMSVQDLLISVATFPWWYVLFIPGHNSQCDQYMAMPYMNVALTF